MYQNNYKLQKRQKYEETKKLSHKKVKQKLQQ